MDICPPPMCVVCIGYKLIDRNNPLLFTPHMLASLVVVVIAPRTDKQ